MFTLTCVLTALYHNLLAESSCVIFIEYPLLPIIGKMDILFTMTQNTETNGDETNTESSARLLAGQNKPRHPMEFLLKGGVVTALPKPGDIAEGVVLEKKGTRLFVDLGPCGTGIVYGREYYAAQEIIKNLNSGDPVSAKVVEPDNEEGYTELSLKEAGDEKRWVELKKMMQEGTLLDLPVLEANRGGLIVEARGIKGFLPASHLSSKNYPRVEGGDKERIYQELQKLVGQPLKLKILDIDPAEGKLIFTEKGQYNEDVQAALTKYKVGDEVEGEITSVVDFGAFMKFDESFEGLIHISEIDWTLIDDPREILKIGERVRAKIIDIRKDKVSLSLKQLKEDPWTKVADKYKKGDTINAKVTKFNPFGAFAQLDKDIHGLAHISEFGTEIKMREMLELGKEHAFKILMIDPKEHRMSLGLPKDGTENKEEGAGEVEKTEETK